MITEFNRVSFPETNIGAFAGGDYKHVYYSLYKGIHDITVNPTNNGATTWTVYQCSTNKHLCWSQEVFSFICHVMNDVQTERPCETLHIDLFNSVSQKSNNEKIMSPIFDNIQLPS